MYNFVFIPPTVVTARQTILISVIIGRRKLIYRNKGRTNTIGQSGQQYRMVVTCLYPFLPILIISFTHFTLYNYIIIYILVVLVILMRLAQLSELRPRALLPAYCYIAIYLFTVNVIAQLKEFLMLSSGVFFLYEIGLLQLTYLAGLLMASKKNLQS